MRSIELALLFDHLERPIITPNHITILANVMSFVCNALAPYSAVEIFGNISTAFGTLAIR